MPLDWPAVTAILNTHAGRHVVLPRALDSILAQTYDDFDLVVVYDGPPDDATIDILKEYDGRFAARNVACTLLGLDEPSGYQCKPKNWATYNALGDYIAYLDSDNEWTPRHLEVLVAAMEEGREWPDFAYGRRTYVADEGVEVETPQRKLPIGDSEYVPWGDGAIARIGANAMYNFIDTSDFIVAKGALYRMQLDTGKMWNEEWRRFGDWELLTRGIYFAGWRGRDVDEVVQTYHWQADSMQLTRSLNEVPQAVKLT
jgi:glycosyltransferase involved in cell wall biosynthesis